MKKITALVLIALLNTSPLLADSRVALEISAQNRDKILYEMRELLRSSQEILDGIVKNDMELVEKAARKSGMSMMGGTPSEVARILPKDFKTLGPNVHKGFERIANEADGFGDTKKIIRILAETQNNCVTCHDLYRFEVKK